MPAPSPDDFNPPLRPFSLLVKPASADCNLRCRYCFYLDHCDFYPESTVHHMSDQVLEQMIRTYMGTRQPQYSFGWQGGEPTLLGVDFFRRVVQLQQKHGYSGASVGNGVQTNGTLITDEMARHFAKYQFLLGVSLDGPAEIHNKYRLTRGGKGSHELVMRGLRRLRENHAEFNILTLVSESNVRHPREVYRYLCDHEYLFHQYIPCVEADPQRQLLPFAITAEQWGEFMCGIFDEWKERDTRRVSVRLFDSVLMLLVEGVRNVCHLGRDCRQYFVVEYNGDVFPCDFYVETPLKLGNLLRESWTTLQNSPVYADFGALKTQWHPTCDSCRFAAICSGDCLKNRLYSSGGDPRRLSKLCKGWKMFFSHALPEFQRLARELVAERRRDQAPVFASAPQTSEAPSAGEPRRNDPCPCGSGRKYKRCCGVR